MLTSLPTTRFPSFIGLTRSPCLPAGSSTSRARQCTVFLIVPAFNADNDDTRRLRGPAILCGGDGAVLLGGNPRNPRNPRNPAETRTRKPGETRDSIRKSQCLRRFPRRV